MKHLLAFRPLLCSFVLLLAIVRAGHAQAPTLVVDQAATMPSLATPGSGSIWDLTEYTDAQGNTYQAGSFAGTVHFGGFTFTVGGGDVEVVVAKRNAAGVYLWAITGGGAGEQRCKALAVDAAGTVYLTGSFPSATATFGATVLTNRRPAGRYINDIFVVKVSASGWQWAVSAGGGDFISGEDYGTAVAADALGNVYVAGTKTSTVAFFGSIQVPSPDPFGGNIVFVAKLDASGTWQWVRTSTSSGNTPTHLIAEPGGTTYLAGECSGYLSYGPFLLLNPGGRQVQFVAKLDPTGIWQWLTKSVANRRNMGTSQHTSIIWDGQHGAYLTGYFSGDSLSFGTSRLVNSGPILQPESTKSIEAFVARLNTLTGRWDWAVQSRGDGDGFLNAPWLDGTGHVYVGGWCKNLSGTGTPGARFGMATLTSVVGQDIVIARLDTAGTWDWARRVGGTNDESAEPRYLNGQGQVVVAGTFTGSTLPLGTVTLTATPSAFTYGNTNYATTAFTATLGANGPLTTAAPGRAPAWTVYPNPARTAITVAGLAPGQPVHLLDLLGREVLRGTVPKQGELQLALPAGLASGVYIVRAGVQAQQLVVE